MHGRSLSPNLQPSEPVESLMMRKEEGGASVSQLSQSTHTFGIVHAQTDNSVAPEIRKFTFTGSATALLYNEGDYSGSKNAVQSNGMNVTLKLRGNNPMITRGEVVVGRYHDNVRG